MVVSGSHDIAPRLRDARFILVSFEGPDRYSQAGGLGIRVSGLAQTLAELGCETHLFFIGDPDMPGEESSLDGRLILHRWGQWISRNCRRGVYDGEDAKAHDMAASLPLYVVDRLVAPAIASRHIPVLIFEEWQTAESACLVAEALRRRGLLDQALVFWNANNPYGFERIDWRRLAANVTITAVSAYMRNIRRSRGADARIGPNGIPESALVPANKRAVSRVRAALGAANGGFLFKMARWEREKGWSQALDAIAQLSRRVSGTRRSPILIARAGGPTGYGHALAHDASARGLRVRTFESEGQFLATIGSGIGDDTDLVSLQFGVTHALARTLYAAADGVLANSISEPFGLVGLEAMAVGGVVFTGGTGEDYAVDRHNAVVLETTDPGELVGRWNELAESPRLRTRIRRAARRTARAYEWPRVTDLLFDTLSGQATRQGLLESTPAAPPKEASTLTMPMAKGKSENHSPATDVGWPSRAASA